MQLCKSPLSIVVDGKHYDVGCGKCRQCLKVRRSAWSQRLSMEHEHSNCTKFVTITYDDLHLPPLYCEVDENGEERFWYTLNKRDCQLFLKRLRRSFEASFGKFRYFLVGEFGDKSARPHYHLIMFFDKRFENDELKIAILKTWQKGFIIDVQDVRHDGAFHYLADYIGKQLGDDGFNQERFEEDMYKGMYFDDFKHKWNNIKSRPKTFTLQSRRPAIGRCYADNPIKRKYHHSNIVGNATYLAKGNDKSFTTPLCRYIRDRIYNDSQKEELRNFLESKSIQERKTFESNNPNSDYNVYVREQRKMNDFKLKQKQK